MSLCLEKDTFVIPPTVESSGAKRSQFIAQMKAKLLSQPSSSVSITASPSKSSASRQPATAPKSNTFRRTTSKQQLLPASNGSVADHAMQVTSDSTSGAPVTDQRLQSSNSPSTLGQTTNMGDSMTAQHNPSPQSEYL